MSRHKSQLRGGVTIESYFTGNNEAGNAAPHNVVVAALGRSGKRYGYFLTDEQAEKFVLELEYLLANDYCSFNVLAMQQVMQRGAAGLDNASAQPLAICAIQLYTFVNNGSVDTIALASASHTMLLACDIFLSAVPGSTNKASDAIIVECVNVWETAEALVLNRDLDAIEVHATALGACIMGCLYAASTDIAQYIGSSRSFMRQQEAITKTVRKGRSALKDLDAGLVSEDFLGAIVSVWDSAVDGCQKYGMRSGEIIVISAQKTQQAEQTKESNKVVPDIHVQRNLSKSYTFTLKSGVSVDVAAILHDNGALKHIVCSTDGLDYERSALLHTVIASISVGLGAGVPLAVYVHALADRHEQEALGIEVTQLVDTLLCRLALDFLDRETLDELGIYESSSNQLALISEQNTEPVLTSRACTDCGAAISQVGKYYLCMECGSAAV